MPFNILYTTCMKSRFIRSVVAISSGTAMSQLLLVLSTPLLTRLYLPSDFGVFAVFNSLLSTAVVASSLRYEIAIPLPRRHKHAAYIVILSLLINTLICLIIGIIVVFWPDEIARYIKTPLLKNYLWLLPVGVLCLGVYKVFNYWAIRHKAYNEIAKTKIIQSASSVIVQVGAGLLSFGAAGLISGRMIGQSAGAFRLARGTHLFDLIRTTRKILAKLLITALTYKNFLKYDVAASIIDALNIQLPQIMLAAIFGPLVSGYYMLSNRVLAMPASLLGQAVGQVYYGNWNDALLHGNISKSTDRVIIILIALIIIPGLVTFFTGVYLFPIIFGPAWLQAGLFAKWMIFGTAAQFVYSPVSMALMATNGQKTNLTINSFLLICKLGACFAGYVLKNSLLTIQFFSFATMIVYILGIFIIRRRLTTITIKSIKEF